MVFSHFISHGLSADCRDTKAVLILALKKSCCEFYKPAVERKMHGPTSLSPGYVYIKSSL